MKKFEEYVLTDFIPQNVRVNPEGIHEIDINRIHELKIKPAKNEELLKILKQYSITIKEEDIAEKITQDDRSPLVRDFDYGKVASFDNQKIDEPVKAKIEYDETETPIFEDYRMLDDYLEKEFIPKSIKTKKIKDPETGDVEFYSSVQLNQLTKLKLSEQEFKHAVEFLEEKDIRVAGKNSSVDSEFNNYDYLVTYKTTHLPATMNWNEQATLFAQYAETKDPEIKQRLIAANLRLVPFITYKLAHTYKIDINELNSYGYERLIEIIDSFDLTLGNRFSTFAYISIRRYVTRNLPLLIGFRHLNIYQEYMLATETIQGFYDEEGMNSDVALEEIIDFMGTVNNYSKKKTRNVNHELLLANAENIDDFAEDEAYGYDFSDKRILDNIAHDALLDVLDTLTQREAKVLIERYGLEDGRFKSLDEVASMNNVSRERIRQIETKAFRKLRHPTRSRKIYSLLEDYNEQCDESVSFSKIG